MEVYISQDYYLTSTICSRSIVVIPLTNIGACVLSLRVESCIDVMVEKGVKPGLVNHWPDSGCLKNNQYHIVRLSVVFKIGKIAGAI